MVSTKPYLVRAIFEWCVDQGFTPYMTVVVGPRTRVPREFVKDGQIVLNVGPDATNQLLLGNEEITFQARFNGVAFPVVVPMLRWARWTTLLLSHRLTIPPIPRRILRPAGRA